MTQTKAMILQFYGWQLFDGQRGLNCQASNSLFLAFLGASGVEFIILRILAAASVELIMFSIFWCRRSRTCYF
jgi:hypothetical protein